MLYRNQYEHGWNQVDSDQVAASFLSGLMWVRPTSKEERIRIIELIEGDGYVPIKDKEVIADSRFPLIINLVKKEFDCFESVLATSCAANYHRYISEKEFYVLYSLREYRTTTIDMEDK